MENNKCYNGKRNYVLICASEDIEESEFILTIIVGIDLVILKEKIKIKGMMHGNPLSSRLLRAKLL